jgi:hypothetical protein
MPRIPSSYQPALEGLLDTTAPLAVLPARPAAAGLVRGLRALLDKKHPKFFQSLGEHPSNVMVDALNALTDARAEYQPRGLFIPRPERHPFAAAHEVGHLLGGKPGYPGTSQLYEQTSPLMQRFSAAIERAHPRQFGRDPYGWRGDKGSELFADLFAREVSGTERVDDVAHLFTELFRKNPRWPESSRRQWLLNEAFRNMLTERGASALQTSGTPLTSFLDRLIP